MADAAKDRDARLRGMVAAHFEFIWRALRGLGVPAGNVDDAAQQVFWIAAQKLDLITLAASARSSSPPRAASQPTRDALAREAESKPMMERSR